VVYWIVKSHLSNAGAISNALATLQEQYQTKIICEEESNKFENTLN